jgi:predicted GIY-YIG superfamily endonuclease
VTRAERTAVYRFFAANDSLLYVGITADLMTRWRHHEKNSDWWSKQVRIEVVWHESRAAADAEETEAIRTEGALSNVQKRGRTPIRSLRVGSELWDEFGVAAAAVGMTRTEVLRGFLDWFLRAPGSRLPARPTAEQLADARRKFDERRDVAA